MRVRACWSSGAHRFLQRPPFCRIWAIQHNVVLDCVLCCAFCAVRSGCTLIVQPYVLTYISLCIFVQTCLRWIAVDIWGRRNPQRTSSVGGGEGGMGAAFGRRIQSPPITYWHSKSQIDTPIQGSAQKQFTTDPFLPQPQVRARTCPQVGTMGGLPEGFATSRTDV